MCPTRQAKKSTEGLQCEKRAGKLVVCNETIKTKIEKLAMYTNKKQIGYNTGTATVNINR